MSRTITDSGSVSCTDKAGRAGVSGFYKIFIWKSSCFSAKRYQHDGSGFSSSVVEYGVEHSGPDSQGSPYWPSSPRFTSLLDSRRLWRLSRSHLQPCRIRLVGSRSRYSEHDHCGDRSLFRLCLPSEESSGIWAWGPQGS